MSGTVFKLEGTVGTAEVTALRASLAALPEGDDVVVDLAEVERLGGAALQLLLAFKRDRALAGRRVSRVGAPASVARTMSSQGWSELTTAG